MTPSCPTFVLIMFVSLWSVRRLLNRDFQVRVGPAALKSAAAFPGFVIRLDADDIGPRRAERRGRADHAVLLARQTCGRELHIARPAEFVQRDGAREVWSA